MKRYPVGEQLLKEQSTRQNTDEMKSHSVGEQLVDMAKHR